MDPTQTTAKTSNATRTATIIAVVCLAIGFGAGLLTFAVFRTSIKVADDTPAATTTTSNTYATVVPNTTTIDLTGPSYDAIKSSVQAVAAAQGITDTSSIDAYVSQFQAAMPQIVDTLGLTDDAIVSETQANTVINNINRNAEPNDLGDNPALNFNTNSGGGGLDLPLTCPGCNGICLYGQCITIQPEIGGVKDFLSGGGIDKLHMEKLRISFKISF